MRILMIGSALTVNGGIQRYILNLLGSMDLDRYPVDLLATRAPAGVPSGEEELRAAGVKNIFWMPGDDKQRLFFYRSFFREHPGYDIIHFHTTSKVNALACGVIDTAMNARLAPEEARDLTDEIPAGRFGTPEETARLVLMLADAPSYMTGQIIGIDGGFL